MTLEFTPDGIEALADIAFEVNSTTQNIGARRLHTILERVVEDISFDGPDRKDKNVRIDGACVAPKITGHSGQRGSEPLYSLVKR